MIVVCPKCKSRLKVSEEKIAPGGSRFKCPKCSGILLVKRPAKKEAAKELKALDRKKVIIAHAEHTVIERIKSALSSAGYEMLTSTDGVDMMIKTLKELPHLAILDVALPKIYGFEVCKRLKGREETKQMKLILISSVYDKRRYRREPVSLYGADAYIDEHEIEDVLLRNIDALKQQEAAKDKEPLMPPTAVKTPVEAEKPLRPEITLPPPEAKVKPPEDDITVKARRLVRTMLSDIYLYSSQKVEDAVRSNRFYEAFATELKEGKKLYENRIPLEIRNKGDFFKEEVDNFINIRKKSLGV